jgi:predicted acetyltransferase
MDLTLARPSLALCPSYLAFVEELRAAGDTVWPGRVPADDEPAEAFVLRQLRRESAPEPGAVPESVYWGVVDGCVVGRIALRHALDERLARFGGHVGYEVRPSWRRRGVATALLRLVLATDHARALGRVLVTCAPANTGSRRAIEANGGELAAIVFSEEAQRDTCHYWLQTSSIHDSRVGIR